MYVKILPVNPEFGKSLMVIISKIATIKKLKEEISVQTSVPPEKQILIHRGKILADNVTIVEYGIKLGEVIIFKIKEPGSEQEDSVEKEPDRLVPDVVEQRVEVLTDASSRFYKIGDVVDVCFNDSGSNGAWYEAAIIKIFTKEGEMGEEEEDVFYYRVKGDRHVIPFEVDVKFQEIRPVSHYKYQISELKEGMVVLVNYNIDKPKLRGLWYDLNITNVSKGSIKGTLLVGLGRTPVENCVVKFVQEIMRIELPALLSKRNSEDPTIPPLREYPLYCNKCKDVRNRKCKECGCRICGGKDSCDTILLCDDCNDGYHTGCLNPPLETVPEDSEWYCPECKIDDSEIVKAGESLKASKKKIKLPSNNNELTRDWGRGMACISRTTVCTIVSIDHFGPIPGIEVGTCWKFRMQVSEAGVHRSPVAGIHGRENDGAYSIVLSGGYEDDVDNGDEFYYTGSGGRDLSGNRRVNVQSADQELTKMNRALALNCNAPFNDVTGAKAKDWKEGKPVRVVRNYKASKHSKYAPTDGNRYDGIYKVVRYFPEVGKSGFRVWKYFLRRDDPVPAPWNNPDYELEMIYPPNYLEAKEAEERLKQLKKGKENNTQSSSKNLKRKRNDKLNASTDKSSKILKMLEYVLPESVEEQIKVDKANEEHWNICKEFVKNGKKVFLEKVQEVFMCPCCQDLVLKPVTTICKHNYCKSCMEATFKSGIETCPLCRCQLDKDSIPEINETLRKALLLLFPGYETRHK